MKAIFDGELSSPQRLYYSKWSPCWKPPFKTAPPSWQNWKKWCGNI